MGLLSARGFRRQAVKTLPYAVLGFIAVLFLIGLALPRHAVVETSIRTDAQPATVFALINDFRQVSLWTTRYDADPNVRLVYRGPRRGVGATVSWDSALIGSGTEVIVESRPFESVVTAVNPGEPGESSNRYRITAIGAIGTGTGGTGTGGTVGGTVGTVGTGTELTELTWRFETDYGFNVLARFMALLVRGVLEQELADGIRNLAALAESQPRTDSGDIEAQT